MKLIKRHKGLAIVGGLTLLLLLILFIICSKMIFSTGKTEYGDRLNNIVKIEKKVLDDAKTAIENEKEVEKASIRTQGKIIYTLITVSKDTKKDRAKEIAKKSLENYSEEIMECYDVEFLITQEPILNDEGVDSAYTIAGTKHPDNDYISWTKN